MSEVASKWGEAVAGRGFTQIPNYLLLLNQFLDEDSRLSPIELLILFQLAGAWWSKDKQPFPSMRTLAARCGASERQVQRSINRLVDEGLLARVKRRSQGIIASNAYDMAPLVVFLGKVSKAFPNGYPRKIDQRVRTANKITAAFGAVEDDEAKAKQAQFQADLVAAFADEEDEEEKQKVYINIGG